MSNLLCQGMFFIVDPDEIQSKTYLSEIKEKKINKKECEKMEPKVTCPAI